MMRIGLILPAIAVAVVLTGCSGVGDDTANPPPATEVRAVLPIRQTFHRQVAAFGQLAADSRNALSLSLPQAGQVIAIDAIAGHRAQRGEVLLRLVTDPAARSAYLQAQSALRTARGDLARTRRLHAEQLATNTQLDAARKTLADAQAALDAQAGLGGAQAVAKLRAPTNGVVTGLAVQRGQRVAAGIPLMQFTPTSALVALLGIDPGANVPAGSPVTFKPVYAARGTPPLHGMVTLVSAAVNPQTHLVDVVATVDAHAPLAAGTSLAATIDTARFKAWAVPRNALQSDARGSYILQVEHGKARRVAVRVVAPAGSPVGIEGALNPHAPVITLGSYEVTSGDPVRVASAAAAAAAHAGTTAR